MNGNALMDTLSQLAGDNPTMKQLVNLYQAHQSSQTEKKDELETKYKKSLLLIRRYQEQEKVIEEKITESDQKISDLNQLADAFANAIGACPSCFGANWSCAFCHGRGKPGTFDVDHECFEKYILPLFKKPGWHREILDKMVK